MGLLNISHPKDRQVKEEEAKKGARGAEKKSVQRVLTWIVREVRECSQGQSGQACNWLTPDYSGGFVCVCFRVCVQSDNI